MDISAGATAKATQNPVYLGYQSSGNGTMTIDGAGSSFQLSQASSSLYIGEGGTGKLSITGGGKLDTQGQPITIGDLSGSNGTLTVDGATSSLTSTSNNRSNITVGNSGTGTFSIANDAQVTLASVGVGTGTGGSGTVTVDGAGSRLSIPSGTLQLGNSHTGTSLSASVTVQNGAALSASAAQFGKPVRVWHQYPDLRRSRDDGQFHGYFGWTIQRVPRSGSYSKRSGGECQPAN